MVEEGGEEGVGGGRGMSCSDDEFSDTSSDAPDVGEVVAEARTGSASDGEFSGTSSDAPRLAHPTHPPEEELVPSPCVRAAARSLTLMEQVLAQQSGVDARRVQSRPQRRSHGSLDARERQPLGGGAHPTWTLPDGTPYQGPADIDRLRQGREARHWLETTGATKAAAMDLLTAGGYKRRAREWEPGVGDDPGYVWPNLAYHQLKRQKATSAEANRSRTAKRKAARESRDPRAHCARRALLCEADMEEVTRLARSWRVAHPAAMLRMPQLLPMVVEVAKWRDEQQRSKMANALLAAVAADDTGRVLREGTDAQGAALVGEGFLSRVRRCCPKVQQAAASVAVRVGAARDVAEQGNSYACWAFPFQLHRIPELAAVGALHLTRRCVRCVWCAGECLGVRVCVCVAGNSYACRPFQFQLHRIPELAVGALHLTRRCVWCAGA